MTTRSIPAAMPGRIGHVGHRIAEDLAQYRQVTGDDDNSGRTVYHCHILDHEDNGMMGAIDVA